MRTRAFISSFAHALSFAFVATPAHAQTSYSRDYLEGDVSYASASGNSSFSTFSIRDRLIHTRGAWMITEAAAYLDSKVKDRDNANEFRVSVRLDHFLRPNVGVFIGGANERNTAAGFRTRADEYGGMVWRVVHSRDDSLALDAGAQMTEEVDNGSGQGRYVAGRGAAAYKHIFKNSAYFLQFGEYLPSMNSHWGTRINTESEALAPITEHLGLVLNYIIRYESKPPPGYGTMDRTLTMGVQLRY